MVMAIMYLNISPKGGITLSSAQRGMVVDVVVVVFILKRNHCCQNVRNTSIIELYHHLFHLIFIKAAVLIVIVLKIVSQTTIISLFPKGAERVVVGVDVLEGFHGLWSGAGIPRLPPYCSILGGTCHLPQEGGGQSQSCHIPTDMQQMPSQIVANCIDLFYTEGVTHLENLLNPIIKDFNGFFFKVYC
jgi:hypothetical protein